MSHNFRTSNESPVLSVGRVFWGISPAIVSLAIVFIGGSVAPDQFWNALLVAALLSFALAYTWSLRVLSRAALPEIARFVLAIPMALAVLMVNSFIAGFGCTFLMVTLGGI